jgi:dihydrofolate reductase
MALRLCVFIASSIDNYIATVGDSLDWLLSAGSSDEDYGVGPFLSSVDAVAMGRGTYRFVDNPTEAGEPLGV